MKLVTGSELERRTMEGVGGSFFLVVVRENKRLDQTMFTLGLSRELLKGRCGGGRWNPL